MLGVEFDNGDMYVDGHKAASDVRDEFVSVTEKLMDELAQCYNVLPQLDINNTIDHRPEGDEKWFLENEKTVTQFCRKLARSEERFSRNAETDLVCRLLLEKKKFKLPLATAHWMFDQIHLHASYMLSPPLASVLVRFHSRHFILIDL